MWPHAMWGWFPFMWIFPLALVIVVLLLLFRGDHWPTYYWRERRDREDSAREILDRRYARGEISQEEYQRMKKALET